jgi:DNA polymerase-1
MAKEKWIIEGFKDPDFDPHQLMADRIGCTRTKAKNINFSLIYDISPHGLNTRYDIPIKEGKELKEAWQKECPAICKYHERQRKTLAEKGYVENFFGWRRHLSKNPSDHEVRQAYNFPIQNAAVVIGYQAMLEIQRRLQSLKALLIGQIHDSIILDVPKREINKVIKICTECMLNIDVGIPLGVDAKVGDHL